MTFEQILKRAAPDETLIIDDKEFRIAGIEKIRLSTGDRMVWMWSDAGDWFIVDEDGDELTLLHPVEQEVEQEEDEFALYLGNSYDQASEDEGVMERKDGETDHEDGDAFSAVHYESSNNAVLRRLTWTGYGEEIWFYGKMLEEDDVKIA